jgi:hypothetical protein
LSVRRIPSRMTLKAFEVMIITAYDTTRTPSDPSNLVDTCHHDPHSTAHTTSHTVGIGKRGAHRRTLRAGPSRHVQRSPSRTVKVPNDSDLAKYFRAWCLSRYCQGGKKLGKKKTEPPAGKCQGFLQQVNWCFQSTASAITATRPLRGPRPAGSGSSRRDAGPRAVRRAQDASASPRRKSRAVPVPSGLRHHRERPSTKPL